MRKKLIVALIVVCLLLAAAVGVLVYMESRPSEQPGETTAPAVTETQGAGETTHPVETTEETVGISLPAEDPDEVTPEDTFGEEDLVPPVTSGGENVPETTEDPDANETPEDIF